MIVNVLCPSNQRESQETETSELRTPKKEYSLNTYLLDIKKMVDNLADVGASIIVEHHIDAMFDGLFNEYDHFIMSITSFLDLIRLMMLKWFFLLKKRGLRNIVSLMDLLSSKSILSLVCGLCQINKIDIATMVRKTRRKLSFPYTNSTLNAFSGIKNNNRGSWNSS